MIFTKAFSQKLTALAVLWLVFTLSLVGWWWYHSLSTVSDERVQRMFLWEGGFLFLVLLIGGVGLVYLTHHHQSRHERLKMFFATFAHDLKTSISRLRLQGELLEESPLGQNPKLQAILRDIHRLDLQLENSLWLAQLDSNKLLIQETKLSEVMDNLRNEFSEIRFELSRDSRLAIDRRAFAVILRNLFNNSVQHGQADRVEMTVTETSSGSVQIVVADNGGGVKGSIEDLGRNVLLGSHRHSNGLGLFLSRRLIERMDGELSFAQDPSFKAILKLKGRLS